MASNPNPPPRTNWQFFIFGVIIVRPMIALFWACSAGLAWGCAASIAHLAGAPEHQTLAGAAGVALLATMILGLEGKRRDMLAMAFVAFGAAGIALVSMRLLIPDGSALRKLGYVAVGLAFFLGAFTAIFRQSFPPLKFHIAPAIAILGTAVLVALITFVGGPAGWALGAGASLSTMVAFAVLMQQQPIIEVDADEMPVREVPRSEAALRTLQSDWSLFSPFSLGWNGAIAGLLAYYWTTWAIDHPRSEQIWNPFLGTGLFAIAIAVLSQLKAQPNPSTDSTATEKASQPPGE